MPSIVVVPLYTCTIWKTLSSHPDFRPCCNSHPIRLQYESLHTARSAHNFTNIVGNWTFKFFPVWWITMESYCSFNLYFPKEWDFASFLMLKDTFPFLWLVSFNLLPVFSYWLWRFSLHIWDNFNVILVMIISQVVFFFSIKWLLMFMSLNLPNLFYGFWIFISNV